MKDGRHAIRLALGTVLAMATHLDREKKLSGDEAKAFIRLAADISRLQMVHQYREDYIAEGADDSLEELDLSDMNEHANYMGWLLPRTIELADFMRMRHMPPGEAIRACEKILHYLRHDNCPLLQWPLEALAHISGNLKAPDFMDKIMEPGFKFREDK